MAVRLGIEGKLYRNSGTYGGPTLVEVTNVKDVTLNLEKATADITTRGSLGWRQMVGTLRDATVDFQMVWNTGDANFTAIKNAFLANDVAGQTMELFIMSTDVDDADSEGLRASFMVEKFTRNEALEDAMTVDVTIRPTFSANPPAWVSGTPYAAYD
jgi:predicted secreted protein